MRTGDPIKVLVLVLTGFPGLGTALQAVADSTLIDFNKDIRPIFAQHCIACHGGVKQAGGLSFVYRDNVFAGGDSGMPAVAASDPDGSYLLERVTDQDPETRMPPGEHGPALAVEDIEKLRQWIDQGAKWELPWAYTPPQSPALPTVQQPDWCLKPFDRFVLAQLEAVGLQPSPPAERVEWLRRVSFDLIGLPPTSSEVDDYLQDTSGDAEQRVVERLLSSPHFGERWASLWLDLARYADTTGYEQDPHRDIWPYRDWVIRAFNADMPFDKFTIRQLAGDLLDEATLDDRLATAFHRNTQTNSEGGTDDEEFRLTAVIDRVNTTWQVWQATTFGCVQCHSHPYEPYEHEDYYRFMAIFNNSRDADVDEDLPRLDVPLDRQNDSICLANLRRASELRRTFHEPLNTLAAKDQAWRDLPIDRATSTGSARLEIQRKTSSGKRLSTQVRVENSATIKSLFTLEAPLPRDIGQITALRIDALLRDPEAAEKLPELGFVLSHLKATLLPPGGGKPVKLAFTHAFSDEAEPLLEPTDSLHEDDAGWGSYSRQWLPHHAVFLLKQAVEIQPGSRIKLELVQNRSTSGDVALVLKQSSYSVSADEDWVRVQQAPDRVAVQEELEKLEQQQKEILHISVPVMGELTSHQGRVTQVFTRGLWLDKGQPVQPGIPALLSPSASGIPVDRLAMARWLVSEKNPLTARVLVNRIWAQFFGTGIVETAEDFGTSGTLPTHPELLDYIALEFRNNYAWSLKRLMREIALSATYRQSAKTLPIHLSQDPENRLLSRGPRMRLTAEMVRDQALLLSGQFSPKMFGPPVMPPQPEGVWRSVYSNAKWTTASGEDRYRRAIYTYWKRTSGYPSMMTFDVPSREVCTARRISTNTPLQALVSLNDEAYVECAQGLAKQMLARENASPAERVTWAYQRATGHQPSPATLDSLLRLWEKCRDQYTENSAEAKKLGDSAEAAAYVVVASTIMNLDEVLTK